MKIRKKTLGLACLILTVSSYSFSMDSRDFVDCFKKAYNERILEIKEKHPEKADVLCDQMSEADSYRVNESFVPIIDAEILPYYSAEEMNAVTLDWFYKKLTIHFGRLFDLPTVACYTDSPTNLASAWVIGFKDALVGMAGGYNFNDRQLVADAINKMAGRKIGKSVSNFKPFVERKFDYCLDE